MEMRPSNRTRSSSSELFNSSQCSSDAPSFESDYVYPDELMHAGPPNNLYHNLETRAVVNGVRYELSHEINPQSPHAFELPSKEDLLDADTVALWSSSLFDGEESTDMRDDSVAPMRDFNKQYPIISATKSVEERSVASTNATTTTFQSDDEDSSAFSSSCFSPVFDDMANDLRESGIFSCATETATLYADGSSAFVETAATELLKESALLQSADDFFSDDQQTSLKITFSEVSREFDEAGNRVMDLTAKMSLRHLCVKKQDVDEPEEVTSQCTVPSEVTFKVRVLKTLNRNKKRKTVDRQQKQNEKGLFRKLKGHFARKGRVPYQ